MASYDVEKCIKNLMVSPRVVALRQRSRRCVCKYCGSNLRLRQIVYNNIVEPRIEIFCEHCNRIEYGVEPEIYHMAKYYVDEFGCDYYPDLDENTTKERMNVAKVCEIIDWAFKGVGYIDLDGFKYPIELDKSISSEDLQLNLDELEELDEELQEVVKSGL